MLYNMFKYFKIRKFPELKTVPNVNLEKYSGHWYEIARLPFFFEKGLVGCESNYTFDKNGALHIENTGHKDSLNGPVKVAKATATPKDSSNSKLLIRYSVPIYAPYYIIDVDNDYKWALVGEPSRDNLWIISREKNLDGKIYSKLVEKAKQQGFEVDKLIKTPQ